MPEVTPPMGYRFLRKGETLRDGDRVNREPEVDKVQREFFGDLVALESTFIRLVPCAKNVTDLDRSELGYAVRQFAGVPSPASNTEMAAIAGVFDGSAGDDANALFMEIIWSAMHFLKQKPESTIAEAIDFGINEWVK